MYKMQKNMYKRWKIIERDHLVKIESKIMGAELISTEWHLKLTKG